MQVLLTCKNEDDLIKNEGARVVTTFSHYKTMDFFQTFKGSYSAVLGPIWPNFKLVLDAMNVLVICKNKEDPIKNESARLVTRLSPL